MLSLNLFLRKKDSCVVTEIYFALLAFVNPNSVWCLGYIIKQLFHADFCLLLKLFTIGKIIFNSASRDLLIIVIFNFYFSIFKFLLFLLFFSFLLLLLLFYFFVLSNRFHICIIIEINKIE